MPRPKLALGQLGEISYKTEGGHRRVRARARYRDVAGVTRQIEATGTSKAAARKALETKFGDRMAASAGQELTPDSTIETLARVWLDEIEDSDRRPQTVAAYRQNLESTILPGVGGLVLCEATTGRLDRWLKSLAREHPSAAKRARVVLRMMFALAARHDVVTQNPVVDTVLPAHRQEPPRSLTVEELTRLRAGVRAYVADPEQVGQRRSSDLPDVVDVLLGTGARISEVLALRWSDVDLGATPVTVTIAGTVVPLRGGVVRQPMAKTASGHRTVTVPGFAKTVLSRRFVNHQPNDGDLVFPSDVGTLRWPNNFHRMWRDARESEHLAGFGWVTMRVLRKTVATTITRSMDDETAAAVLGHASTSVTHRHYIQRASVAPDTSAALGALVGEGADENAG